MALNNSIEDREYKKFITDIDDNTAVNVVGNTGLIDPSNDNIAAVNDLGQVNVKPYVLNENGISSPLLGDTLFMGAQIMITPEHHEIHCGDSYTTSRIRDLSHSAVDNILIIVPNESGSGASQKLYHLNVSGDNELEAIWYIYESPTITANGTALSCINRNRNSTNVTGLSVYHTPTITNDGTLLLVSHSGGKEKVGGERKANEFVLKNNTAYLLRCTNVSDQNNYISWYIDHYVHPGI